MAKARASLTATPSAKPSVAPRPARAYAPCRPSPARDCGARRRRRCSAPGCSRRRSGRGCAISQAAIKEFQVGISNIFSNLRFAPRFLNNVFQGKLKGAGIEVGRFLINSTVGLAGFFDLAKHVDLVTSEEDMGQTLGFYGVNPGPYLVLPLLPPFTVRDFVGYVGDVFLNPINWLVVPIIEVNNVPSVIAHKNRMTSSLIQTGSRVGEIVNERSRNLEKYQGVEEATLDLYTAVRNAYLQTRAQAIRE